MNNIGSFNLLTSSQEANVNADLGITTDELHLESWMFSNSGVFSNTGVEDLPLDNVFEQQVEYSSTDINAQLSQYVDVDQKPFQAYNNFCQIPPQITSATGKMPSCEDYSGTYEFELELPDINSGKAWMYSPSLNKVFITMGNRFPILFKWKQGLISDLRVRALPVFMLSEHVPEPVVRCFNHGALTDAANKDFDSNLLDHIIRTDNSNAEYCKDDSSERLSLVVPLGRPQAGDDHYAVNYTFVCKNSCSSGMNRRATHLIFTLEDAMGKVLGRKILQFRVCSCPKRDKGKEERDLLLKTLENDPKDTPKGKRPLKRELDDLPKRPKLEDTVYQVSVLGEEAHQDCLKYVLGQLLQTAKCQNRDLTEKEKSMQGMYLSQINK